MKRTYQLTALEADTIIAMAQNVQNCDSSVPHLGGLIPICDTIKNLGVKYGFIPETMSLMPVRGMFTAHPANADSVETGMSTIDELMSLAAEMTTLENRTTAIKDRTVSKKN